MIQQVSYRHEAFHNGAPKFPLVLDLVHLLVAFVDLGAREVGLPHVHKGSVGHVGDTRRDDSDPLEKVLEA